MRFGWRSPANETGSALVCFLKSEVVLLERLEELEAVSYLLDPQVEARAALWEGARNDAEAFLEALPDAQAFVQRDQPGARLKEWPIAELMAPTVPPSP